MTETNTEGTQDKVRRSREAAIQVGRLSQALFGHFVSWRLMKFSFSLLVLALTAFTFLVLGQEIWKRIPAPPTYGVIVVESPEVYTRERLVNDRLRETAWLERQLLVTETKLGRDTGFTTIEATLRGADHLAVGVAVAPTNAGKSEGTPEGTAAPTVENPGRANSAVGPTTTELFRAMSNFRDEVRAEIMRTQLDDRHDIEGNTLYRLIFDTTVLPGDNTEAWAIVHVRLNPDNQSFYKLNQDLEDEEQDIGNALFEDWHDYLESIVNLAADAISRDVWTRDVSEKSLQSMLNLHSLLKMQIVELATEELGFEHDDKIIVELRRFLDDYIQRLEDNLKASYEREIKGKVDGQLRRLSPEQKSRLDPLPTYEEAVVVCATLRSSERAFNWYYEPSPKTFVTLRCPKVIRSDFERFFATMHFQNIFRSLASTLPRDGDYRFGRRQALFEQLTQSREMCEQEPACKRGTPPREWRARCTVVELYIKLLSVQFDRYFDLQLVGDDLEKCKVMLGEKLDKGGKKVGREAFLKKLTDSPVEAFSYGVTPRNLVQRISASLTATISASLNAATGGLSPASNGAADGPDSTQAILDLLHQTSRDVQAIENRPIVVGYGRSVEPKPEEGSEAARKLSSIADFGWMIGPRLNVDAETNTRPYTHLAGQYPLSAVISVPSWWRRINLDVTTCWVSPSRLQIELETPLDACRAAQGTPDRKATQLQIKLPGDEEEISRLFGFEVIDFPQLIHQRETQALRVGRPGNVVVRGQRLWRSTVVTLGAQMADGIRVLPNMEGIIASFGCVERPEGWSRPRPRRGSLGRPDKLPDGGTAGSGAPSVGNQTGPELYRTVPLRVWTSEGLTEVMNVGIYVTPDTSDPDAAVCESDLREWAQDSPSSE